MSAEQGRPAAKFTDLGHRPPKAEELRQACPFRIDFFSRCCGIDGAAFSRVSERIKTHLAIKAATIWSWGREGERSICLTAYDASEGDALFREFRALIASEPTRAPVRIHTRPDTPGKDPRP